MHQFHGLFDETNLDLLEPGSLDSVHGVSMIATHRTGGNMRYGKYYCCSSGHQNLKIVFDILEGHGVTKQEGISFPTTYHQTSFLLALSIALPRVVVLGVFSLASRRLNQRQEGAEEVPGGHHGL